MVTLCPLAAYADTDSNNAQSSSENTDSVTVDESAVTEENTQGEQIEESQTSLNESNLSSDEVSQPQDSNAASSSDTTLVENSWRYSDGELIDAEESSSGIRLFSRAATSAWEETSDGFVNGNGQVISGAKYKGIDVSHHNGNINWAQVKADNIDFAIIRCGYSTNGTDREWLDNVKGCIDNNIPFGVYLYSYASDASEAKREAQNALNLMSQAGLNPSEVAYPVYFDMEDKTLGSDYVGMATAFCDAIEAAGYKAGVYANLDWWNNKLTSSAFDKWDRWVARYNSSITSPGYEKSFSIWQCSSSGSVKGISGNVDINFDFTDKYNITDEEKRTQLDELAASNKDTLSDGTYVIRMASTSSKVLDVYCASKSNSANVQLWKTTRVGNQFWKVTHDAKGYITFTNVNSGKVLDIDGASSTPGANISQFESRNTYNQKWIVIKNTDNTYRIVSALDENLVVDVYGGSSDNGANVQTWFSNNKVSQRFVFDSAESSDEPATSASLTDKGYYVFKYAADTNKVFDVNGYSQADNASVELYARRDTLNQRWQINAVSGSSNTYMFKSLNSGKYLGVSNDTVVQTASTNASSQWTVEVKDGYHSLRNVATGKYLDIYQGSTENGTKIQVWQQNGKISQKFLLEEVDILAPSAYYITSYSNRNLPIEVYGMSTENSANVQAWKKTSKDNQKWVLSLNSDGTYTISNANSGKVLDVDSSGTTSGTNVSQFENRNTLNQKWNIRYNSDGSFTLVSALDSSLVLNIDGTISSGSNVNIVKNTGAAGQKFSFADIG